MPLELQRVVPDCQTALQPIDQAVALMRPLRYRCCEGHNELYPHRHGVTRQRLRSCAGNPECARVSTETLEYSPAPPTSASKPRCNGFHPTKPTSSTAITRMTPRSTGRPAISAKVGDCGTREAGWFTCSIHPLHARVQLYRYAKAGRAGARIGLSQHLGAERHDFLAARNNFGH